MKKKQKKTVSIDLVYEGSSLQYLIDKFKELGIEDLSKVHLQYNTVSCQCDHGDSYCYCDSSYQDVRYVYEE